MASFSTSKICLKPRPWGEPRKCSRLCWDWEGSPGAQGRCRASPARRPRSAATGAEQAAEGEARQSRTAQNSPFPAVLGKERKGSSTKPRENSPKRQGRARPAARGLSTYLQSCRESPGTEGGGSARASPGASVQTGVCAGLQQSSCTTAVVCIQSIPVLIQKWGYVVQLRIWAWFWCSMSYDSGQPEAASSFDH